MKLSFCIYNCLKTMDKNILGMCKSLCERHNAKLIYCCEYGSRSYGYNTESSDYDIRGIYVKKNPNYYKYLAFQSYKDISADDQIGGFHGDNDIELWDIRKVLSLYYRKCNQIPLCWLTSDVLYYKSDKSEILKTFLLQVNEKQLKKTLCHYHGNSLTHLHRYKLTNKVKTYIMSWVHVMSALYVIKYKKQPPQNIKELISQVTVPKDQILDALEIRKFESEKSNLKLDDLLRLINSIKEEIDRTENTNISFDDTWIEMIESVIN